MKKMISMLTGLAMLAGTAAAMPIHAEEQVKDFNYYWNLDDYSVYCEMVELYGHDLDESHVPEETLPKLNDLPWYSTAKEMVSNDTYCDGFSFTVREDAKLSREEWLELAYTPSYFGFPDSWDVPDAARNDETESVLELWWGDDDNCVGGVIQLDFSELKKMDSGRKDIPVIRSLIDGYRLLLTIEHSQFAQEHLTLRTGMGHYDVWLPCYLGSEAYYMIGDPNGDGIVNAEDAADILNMAADAGAGNEVNFTNDQLSAADVNHDGRFDAADVSVILMYSAALGTGDRYVNIKDFV